MTAGRVAQRLTPRSPHAPRRRPVAAIMANEFIGAQMLITLKEPPAQVKGTISAIDAGKSLTLVNGQCVLRGPLLPS